MPERPISRELAAERMTTTTATNGGAPTPAPPGSAGSPGNEVAVKVAVRVRPLNNREKLHQHQPCVKISSETNQIVIGKDKCFSFDYVLPPRTSQSELYESCGVKNLVQSLFEGYNATVFAYGQTGSGKTYTISGNKTSIEEVGIIPRAVHTMFHIINSQIAAAGGGSQSPSSSAHPMSQRAPPREFTVKVNFLEIYKEELKDLLDPTEKELQIREDESGNTLIYGANEITCTTLEEVMACFDAGTLLRHTGSTQMNEQSSRSHSVFTVSIEQRWTDAPTAKTVRDSSMAYELGNVTANSYYLGAKFHFVDLAGSERVHRTGNVGDRFKESIHINSGLLALGNVISALSAGDGKRRVTHIPYRESKITRILKDSLGGNANTLMICCISPSSCNLDESINAVKYASRARYIKNKPIVNMDPQTQRFVEMQSEIQALREELHRQRLLSANLSSHPASAAHQRGPFDDPASTSSSPSVHEVRQLESRLQTAQSEADHYKKIVKEAFNRFKQISKTDFGAGNAASVTKKLADEWLTIFEASKNRSDFDIEDYAKQKISQLESQLQQALDDLKSDEEIFADKEKEINNLKDMAKNLEQKLSIANRYLEESFTKEKEQQELMLQLQIQLDKLMMNKNNSEASQAPRTVGHHAHQEAAGVLGGGLGSVGGAKALSSNAINKLPSGQGAGSQASSNKQRAKTAPNEDRPLSGTNNLRNRNIFSSPALFSLDRVMQNFRARSQLLTETLEENDNVLQKRHFNSTFDIDKNETDEANENEFEREEDGKFVRRGTFKVEKNASKASEPESRVVSATGPKTQDGKKLRDLKINIKMKEELIKELVANSKFTNRINIQNQHKIDSLQKECNQLKNEVADLQRQLQLQTNLISKDPTKVESELRKRLETSLQKINELESKQKDTAKFLNTTNNSEKKISELEIALGKMKQQNEMLQKKLKDDVEKKMKLEKDFEREQQKLKDLEMRNEHQQKVLKKKTEDLATAQRRLRSASNCNLGPNGTDENANKHWIEQEMEKILQEKRQMELYREELQKREELLKKKELLHQERSELQIKKLRSSQQAKESLAVVEQKIEMLNKQIQQDRTSIQSTKELEDLQNTLAKQRKQLDDRLSQGGVLTPAEERRLIEIDEAIEALEVAIDYENDSIRDHQQKLKDSILVNKNDQNDISESIMQKLGTVPYEETKHLVKKFFGKIIDLKEAENKKQSEINELQVQVEEQARLVDQLKQTLNMSSSDFEKRLIEQKAKSDKSVKMLMQQLGDCNTKIANLEKEISYYRDKLTKPAAAANGKQPESYDASHYMPSAVANNPAGGGSFHLFHESSVAASSTANSVLDSNNNASSSSKASASIKMARKDLRPLTNEELLKRSLKKVSMNSLSTVTSSALDNGSSANNH